MSIKIEFLLRGQDKFISKEIAHEEYFDPEANENLGIDSTPKFLQPYLYVNTDIKEILLVVLHIEINDEKRIFKQTIWNNGNNMLTERIDIGSKNYKEIILSVKIGDKDDLYETIRLYIGANFIVPTYHSLIHSDNNGREIEKKFDTNMYIEMVKKGLIG